jgi:transposase-like protein
MAGFSQGAAWFMLHKLRKAMGDSDTKYLLKGIVEMDDAFWGASDEGGKRGRGTEKKPVIVGLSLNDKGESKHLKVEVVDKIDSAVVAEVAKDMLKPGVAVRTDGLSSYKVLSGEGYEHKGEKFDPEEKPKHLQRYCDEFCYRFNRRHFGIQLFNWLLMTCASSQLVALKIAEITL